MLHRVHDYSHLVTRWRAVAKQAGVQLRKFAHADGFDLFYLQTPCLGSAPGLYVSAGIHGDEPAAPEALLRWAEKHVARLAGRPLLLFPCLNPWGLRNNVRTDASGRDLNRLFHDETHGVITGVRGIAKPHRFSVAITMHEDYDAQGIYLYEVYRGGRHVGEKLLAAGRRLLPADSRAKIEGRTAKAGLIRRRISPKLFERIGLPEAIWLHRQHSDSTFTFETPSEADIELRIRAQMAVLDACLRLVIDR